MFLTSISTRRILYLLIVSTTALIFFTQTTNPQHHWLLWSSLMLALITQGNTFPQRLSVITLTALANLLSVWLVTNAHTLPFALAFILLFITMTCVYYSERYSHYTLALFIINLFGLLGACFPTDTSGEIFILEGAAIALLFQIIFLSEFKKLENHANFHLAMQNLKILNQDIFACFLQRDYPDNQYQYEKRLHVQKTRFLKTITQSKKMDKKIVADLTTLFEILLDCAQLRGRVSDFSIFEVCATELVAINEAMNKLLTSDVLVDTEELNERIQRLEDTYQHVLAVTAKEPLPFMLFIASLRAFSRAIGGMERCGN